MQAGEIKAACIRYHSDSHT